MRDFIFTSMVAYFLRAGFLNSYLRGNSVYDPMAKALIDKEHDYVYYGIHPGEASSHMVGLVF